MTPGATIYYLAPDHAEPSWGIGLLYHHVRLLRTLGFASCLVHQRRGFRASWLDVDVPIRYLDDRAFRPGASDLLVVPEVMAHDRTACALARRRVVFVQNSFLMQSGSDVAVDYAALGYMAALTTMPHEHDIIAAHCGLAPAVVPPFVADYFFVERADLHRLRPRRVLLAGKPEYAKAGYLDYDIVSKLLGRQVKALALRDDGPAWDVQELRTLDHRGVAEAMQEAALLVNVNTLESFNATVAEAMAAGCLAFCCEAYGGRDYLDTGENAFIFPNNYVYPLVGALMRLIEHYDERQGEIQRVREAALATANRYREARTAEALDATYRAWLP